MTIIVTVNEVQVGDRVRTSLNDASNRAHWVTRIERVQGSDEYRLYLGAGGYWEEFPPGTLLIRECRGK